MKDLFFKMIILITIIYMIINITGNIIVNKRYAYISQTDSNEILRDYNTFNILKDIIDNYNKYIVEEKYNELSNITILNGKKDNNFYNELKNKSSLSENSTIKINEIKVLSDDVFKCKYTIVSGNKVTNVSVVIRLDTDKLMFYIINVKI